MTIGSWLSVSVRRGMIDLPATPQTATNMFRLRVLLTGISVLQTEGQALPEVGVGVHHQNGGR